MHADLSPSAAPRESESADLTTTDATLGASQTKPDAGDAAPDTSETAVDASDATPNASLERPDRKRLEEQLSALKRKELELRRAIAIADHPELGEAIRLLDGRAFALARVEAKIAAGLSKAEDRRKEALEKKLATLREKRAELDAQIAEVELEHTNLVRERERALEAEQRAALQDLVQTLGQHAAALNAAGLDVAELVPEIGQRMPQIRALAEELVRARAVQA